MGYLHIIFGIRDIELKALNKKLWLRGGGGGGVAARPPDPLPLHFSPLLLFSFFIHKQCTIFILFLTAPAFFSNVPNTCTVPPVFSRRILPMLSYKRLYLQA